MPFSATENVSEIEWTDTYEKFFRPIMESFGYTCKRSEVLNRPLTKYIVQDLKNSDLVISDITDSNPNVMWELGVRHSLSMKTIMIASIEMKEKIPSDLKPYGLVFYKKDKTAYEDFKQQISNVLKGLENDIDNNSGPVFDALKTDESILSSYGRKQIINKLVALMTEIGGNIDLAEGIANKTIKVGGGLVTTGRYHFQAIEKLTIDNYVFGGTDYVKLLQITRDIMDSSNIRLDLTTASTDREQRDGIQRDLITDSTILVGDLKELLKLTKNIYSAVKSGTHKDEEPYVIISDKLKNEFFHK